MAVLLKFFRGRPNNHPANLKHLIECRFFGLNTHENVSKEISEAAKTFLSKLRQVIENHRGDGGGLSTEGLYRINAEVTKVQKYRLIIDQHPSNPEFYTAK